MSIPTKAIIAVGGFGTRRLPISKAIEKCMLPLLNRPVVDYVVEDCIKAGITDIYFVVSGGADQLRHYYDRDIVLEEYLIKKGKADLIPSITPPPEVTFHYVEQDKQDSRYGTSFPVWLCQSYIGEDESFVVIMGDQCLYRHDGRSELGLLLQEMIEKDTTAGMIGVAVAPELFPQYGMIDFDEQHIFRSIVEKPATKDAPSNQGNASVYVFSGKFMTYIDNDMKRPHTGEYMITDAINEYVSAGNRVYVRQSDAMYLDCGTVDGWVEANRYLLAHST